MSKIICTFVNFYTILNPIMHHIAGCHMHHNAGCHMHHMVQ